MNTPINFVNRSNIATSNDKSNKFDAIKIIEYYTTLHPLNRVSPSSPLYDLAVKQYNENVKNTLVRPAIPSWFCGKIDPDTNELINVPSDQDLRASAGFVLDPLAIQPSTLTGITSGYAVDTCLYWGTPGSYEYNKLCKEGIDAAEAAALVSDWSTSIESGEEARALAYQEQKEKEEMEKEAEANKEKPMDRGSDNPFARLFEGIGHVFSNLFGW